LLRANVCLASSAASATFSVLVTRMRTSVLDMVNALLTTSLSQFVIATRDSLETFVSTSALAATRRLETSALARDHATSVKGTWLRSAPSVLNVRAKLVSRASLVTRSAPRILKAPSVVAMVHATCNTAKQFVCAAMDGEDKTALCLARGMNVGRSAQPRVLVQWTRTATLSAVANQDTVVSLAQSHAQALMRLASHATAMVTVKLMRKRVKAHATVTRHTWEKHVPTVVRWTRTQTWHVAVKTVALVSGMTKKYPMAPGVNARSPSPARLAMSHAQCSKARSVAEMANASSRPLARSLLESASVMLALLALTARAFAPVIPLVKMELFALVTEAAHSISTNGLNAPVMKAGCPTIVSTVCAGQSVVSSTRRLRNVPAQLVRCAANVRQ